MVSEVRSIGHDWPSIEIVATITGGVVALLVELRLSRIRELVLQLGLPFFHGAPTVAVVLAASNTADEPSCGRSQL